MFTGLELIELDALFAKLRARAGPGARAPTPPAGGQGGEVHASTPRVRLRPPSRLPAAVQGSRARTPGRDRQARKGSAAPGPHRFRRAHGAWRHKAARFLRGRFLGAQKKSDAEPGEEQREQDEEAPGGETERETDDKTQDGQPAQPTGPGAGEGEGGKGGRESGGATAGGTRGAEGAQATAKKRNGERRKGHSENPLENRRGASGGPEPGCSSREATEPEQPEA
jgi:hypothetical protein